MRLRVIIRGAVQGVGFRPFVYRLAAKLGLRGWVNNSPQGVFIEVEGERPAMDQFLVKLQTERPARSSIQSLEPTWLDPMGFQGFEIRKSESLGKKSVIVMPDIATCPDCLRELFDPKDRRHLYPFTNCTHCGPRFSIIEALPYDRPNTSMKVFPMCDECRSEYQDPANRRFHAQPNACPKCGPQLEFWDSSRVCENTDSPEVDARGHEALLAAAKAIVGGAIVAVKGLGGFHLMCLASDNSAVQRLRERKHREEKPFAVMFPSVESVLEECEIAPLEQRMLQSPEAPIVLLKQRSGGVAGRRSGGSSTPPSLHHSVSASVAPGNPWLGAMLPYTPLHHLLLRETGTPLVATSGNLSDEPICTDEREVIHRLAGIADHFLVHNRPIVRHVDDSIVRVVADREMVLRRARGFAPLPITLKSDVQSPRSAEATQGRPKSEVVLGVGAHLKNSVALAVGPQVVVSQHIGDLETKAAYQAFTRAAGDLQKLYDVGAARVVADLHPDYLSTQFAKESGLPSMQVQHHVAHVLSCMAENELDAPVLGVSWDGTGFGLDDTVWGGEFIEITRRHDGTEWSRVAHLRQFRLPGGEAAVKEPRRSALGVLHEFTGGRWDRIEESGSLQAFQPAETKTLRQMLDRGLNSPWTSSMGRLFDAVASLTGLRQRVRHEGQAAMQLEFAAEGVDSDESYPLPIAHPQWAGTAQQSPAASSASSPTTHDGPLQIDWAPMIEAVLADARNDTAVGLMSAKFHNALAEAIVAMAAQARIEQVVLTGGCFQNRRLVERAIHRLRQEGFRPYWHQRVPTNDGGIALGQVVADRWGLTVR